jgi:hypothetical protein
LADGVIDDDGDVSLRLAVQLSLRAPMAEDEDDLLFCKQGTYAALAEVPTDIEACLALEGPLWSNLFLSASTYHDDQQSEVVGLSALVRNRAHDALYRLRVLGDSVGPNADGSLGHASATFEYEPLSQPD